MKNRVISLKPSVTLFIWFQIMAQIKKQKRRKMNQIDPIGRVTHESKTTRGL